MSQVTEQSVRFQTALASIKLIQASAVLDLTEDDFDFLTSNKVWIATDRSRARRCVEACVYGTLDFVGYPRFPAPVEFIAAVIAYYVHPVNIQTACLIMEGYQVVSVGADIAFDADPKFFACLVRFESSSVPTTLPTAYDVYPLDGRHDGGYYTVKDCVTIDVLPRTPGNNVYVGFMVWSNFTATKCRGLVSLNQ